MQTADQPSSTQLTMWAAMAGGILVAIMLAVLIGSTETLLLIYFAGSVVVIVLAVSLQAKVWLIIPFAWGFATRTAVLGVPLSLRNCAVLITAVSAAAYLVLSQRRMRWRWEPLVLIVGVNLAYIVLVFVRNPTGFLLMGTESIGGRPYIEIALAAVGLVFMLWLPCSPRTLRWLPYVFLAGEAVRVSLYLPAYFWPDLLYKFRFLYATLDLGAFGAAARQAAATEFVRYGEWGELGLCLVFVLCARYRPLTILQPWRGRFYLALLAGAGLLLSGFRNYLLWGCAAVVVGAWLHRGWREVVVMLGLGVALLGGLVAIHGRVVELPLAAQRTLSFLPGDWSDLATYSAAASSEWRFEMWQAVIKEGMIKSWALGDGFGFSADVFESWLNTRGTGMELLTGAFHNGPLSAIRYAGLAGLLLLYALMATVIVYAVRCVRLCRRTPLQTVAFFLAIQAFWQPFHYTFVFGQYDGQLPTEIMKAGCWLLLLRVAEEVAARKSPIAAPASRPAPGPRVAVPVAT